MTDAREILLGLPSQIEIAAALHAVPVGPHRETIARMATALDCLRDGGWEFVNTSKQPKQSLTQQEHKRLPSGDH